MGNVCCKGKKVKKNEYTVSDVNEFRQEQVTINFNKPIKKETLITEANVENDYGFQDDMEEPRIMDVNRSNKKSYSKLPNDLNKSKASELNKDLSLMFDNMVSISNHYKSMDAESKYLLKETFFNVIDDEISKIIVSNPELLKSNISLE